MACGGHQQQQQQQQQDGADDGGGETNNFELPDEDLRRLLAVKRLSEGCCNRSINLAHYFARKNSLHGIGQDNQLQTVTEGVPLSEQHDSLQGSGSITTKNGANNNNNNTDSSLSSSSSSARSGRTAAWLLRRAESQDDAAGINQPSASSSTSLDSNMLPRSPSCRRGSTLSQCSSVLSEGTRHQLQFDVSPDLAPDSSIAEANAISPTDFDRPASPEPLSDVELRPVSRMSSTCTGNLNDMSDDMIMLSQSNSPDSQLGDSNGADASNDASTSNEPQQQQRHSSNERLSRICKRDYASPSDADAETSGVVNWQQQQPSDETAASGKQRAILDNLERLITNVNGVNVSDGATDNGVGSGANAGCRQIRGSAAPHSSSNTLASAINNSHKRAHTPSDTIVHRNKTSLMSVSPS